MDDQCEPPNFFNAIAIDGAALVHLLPTASITTFDQYADSVIQPHLSKQLEKCVRLDVVWDAYITVSKHQRETSGVKALGGK